MAIQVWPLKEEVKKDGVTWPPKEGSVQKTPKAPEVEKPIEPVQETPVVTEPVVEEVKKEVLEPKTFSSLSSSNPLKQRGRPRK